jgi:hypothetical protein
VLIEGRWVPLGWLPIGQVITTKRKYLENLIRSKSDHIRTIHDDADVATPRNTVQRRTSGNYPTTIIEDGNPLGREWAARVRAGH